MGLLAEQHAEAEQRHARETADFRDLRRAFALGVQEARNQRPRSAALDEKITQLAAAQLVTEEKLQGLVDALRRGGNGKTSTV